MYGKIMILTFSDDEEDIYNGILEVISNSKSLKWCNTFQDTKIHIGATANALERKGIQTERGNVNREIIKHNMMLEQAKATFELAKQEVQSIQYAKIRNAAVSRQCREVYHHKEDRQL